MQLLVGDNLVPLERYDEARGLFERLLALRNDAGLLAEECDPVVRRQLGNFPQAFSHITAFYTSHLRTPRATCSSSNANTRAVKITASTGT